MTNTEIASLLKNRRLELRLRMEDVGKALGVNKSTIYRWENGDINSIKSGHIYLLAKVLHLPIEVVLGFNSTKPIESAEVILLREDINKELENIKDKETLVQIKRIVSTFNP